MHNQHVVITGATAGIGRATAIELARRGARLTLLNRNPDKAAEVAAEFERADLPAPTCMQMDMASLSSVRNAAAELLERENTIDVLINNAGIVNNSRRVTIDGFEETLAVNHFAPFLLTGLLLPAVCRAPSARIINVSSEAHAFAKSMGFDDMQAEHSYRTFREYGRSKLANILFTRSLAKRLSDTPHTVNALHPGAVATGLGTNNPGPLGRIVPALLKPFFKTAEQGAATTIYLASSPDVAGTSGAYFSNCKQKQPKPWALDDNAAQTLWEYTENAVDFRY